MKRTRALLYFSFITYLCSTVIKEMEYLEKFEEVGFAFLFLHITGRLLLHGIGYFAIFSSILSLGHVVSSLYYYIKGYGMSPIFLYPIVIIPSEKKFGIHLNFLDLFKYLYPEKIITKTKENYDTKEVVGICSNAYLYAFYSQIIGSVLWGILFLYQKQYLLMFSMLCNCIVCISFAYVKESLYRGLLVMRKDIRGGAIALYLANQAILYHSKNHWAYTELDNIVMQQNDWDEAQIIETIKHMYMIKCVNSEFPISKNIEEAVEKKYLLRNMNEFSDTWVGDEKYSLLKQYLYTAMICENQGDRNLAIGHLENLESESSRHPTFIPSTFSFYLEIGKENIIRQDKTKFFYNKLLRKNSYYLKFQNYKENYSYVIERVNQLCNVYDGV